MKRDEISNQKQLLSCNEACHCRPLSLCTASILSPSVVSASAPPSLRPSIPPFPYLRVNRGNDLRGLRVQQQDLHALNARHNAVHVIPERRMGGEGGRVSGRGGGEGGRGGGGGGGGGTLRCRLEPRSDTTSECKQPEMHRHEVRGMTSLHRSCPEQPVPGLFDLVVGCEATQHFQIAS